MIAAVVPAVAFIILGDGSDVVAIILGSVAAGCGVALIADWRLRRSA